MSTLLTIAVWYLRSIFPKAERKNALTLRSTIQHDNEESIRRARERNAASRGR